MREGSSYPGGIFSEEVTGGRSAVEIRVGSEGLEAELEQLSWQLPWSELRLETGGASGKMLFCHPAGDDFTLFSESEELLAAIAASAPGALQAQAQAIIAARGRDRNLERGILAALVVGAVLVAVALPSLWRAGVSLVSGALPAVVDEKLGDVGWASMQLETEPLDAPQVEEAAELILERLRDALPPDSHPWDLRLTVSEDEMINAFALPGGRMVVCSGLVEKAPTPDALAGVMAHEIAHVTQRHGVKHLVSSLGIAAQVQLFLGDFTGIIALATQTLATNAWSREQEAEADRIGVEMLHRAGLNPEGLAEFFTLLQEQEDQLEIPEWISTHPAHEERILAVREHARTLGPLGNAQPLELDWESVQASLAD